MPVPKKRKTSSRRNSRRKANYKLNVRKTAACSKCGRPCLPHRVCGNCGYYRGREIVDVLKREHKKSEKTKAAAR